MPHLLVRHKVADYSKWKVVFDSHTAAQQEAGLRITHVWRNIDDPHEVVLLFEVDDLEKAKGFVSSPNVPDAQHQAGVIDQPDIYFLT